MEVKLACSREKGDGVIMGFLLVIVTILCATWLIGTSPVTRTEIAQLIEDNGYFE